MNKLLALLLTADLLLGAVAGMTAPTPAETTPAPVVTPSPVPAAAPLRSMLERLYLEYDPAAAGAVGALRWSEKLLAAYRAEGSDPDRARAAAAEFLADHPEASLSAALERLRAGAEMLTSGADLGLITDSAHRGGPAYTAREAEELFDALAEGMGS